MDYYEAIKIIVHISRLKNKSQKHNAEKVKQVAGGAIGNYVVHSIRLFSSFTELGGKD